jgi:hypothetical protein
MEIRSSIQAIRKAEMAKAHQAAFDLRARTARRWGRRCLCVMMLMGLAIAWQSETFGPVMERQLVDGLGALDSYLGGDGKARDVVIGALSGVR